MIKYDNRTQMAQFMFPHLTVTVSEDYNKPERQICNESDAVHFMYDLIYRKDTETLAVIMLDTCVVLFVTAHSQAIVQNAKNLSFSVFFAVLSSQAQP